MEKVFPAYAGMFRKVLLHKILMLSFPRVCGDVPNWSLRSASLKQFSPRMRGCSAFDNLRGKMDAVFPAYAGMFQV